MHVHAYILYAFTFLPQCVYIFTCIVHIYIYIHIYNKWTFIHHVLRCKLFFLRFFVVFVFVLIENLNAVGCGLRCCC